MSSQSESLSRPAASPDVNAAITVLHEEDHGVDHFGNPHDDRHDRGLEFDVATLLGRRGLGDGSNGPNVLDDSGIVRSDISSSFGSSTTRAEGVPLTINLTVTDAGNGYSAMEGAAIYLWHCNRDGQYSLYSQGVQDQNYLRGVQATNASGTATWTSIYPAAYDGRWPHVHFEVYSSVVDATSSGQIVKTSQIALPEAACKDVYATTGYEASVSNLARTSLTQDMVFGNDGGIHQLATVTGNTTDGYVANLTIGI